jgi:hypothetical protein
MLMPIEGLLATVKTIDMTVQHIHHPFPHLKVREKIDAWRKSGWILHPGTAPYGRTESIDLRGTPLAERHLMRSAAMALAGVLTVLPHRPLTQEVGARIEQQHHSQQHNAQRQ